jgi:septum formation topological specificity factor MinE
MRLIKYINENMSLLEIANELESVKKNCKPYINLVKKSNCKNKFLYKGMYTSYDFKIRTVRKNREPLNMPIILHNYIDKLFKKKFGVKLRSETIFVSSDITLTYEYGTPNIIIPIGKFDYYWNKEIYDLYEDLSFSTNKASKNIDKYKDELKIVIDGYKKNKDFKKMMDKFHGEIMMDCKKYYAIDDVYKNKVEYVLFENKQLKKRSILDIGK